MASFVYNKDGTLQDQFLAVNQIDLSGVKPPAAVKNQEVSYIAVKNSDALVAESPVTTVSGNAGDIEYSVLSDNLSRFTDGVNGDQFTTSGERWSKITIEVLGTATNVGGGTGASVICEVRPFGQSTFVPLSDAGTSYCLPESQALPRAVNVSAVADATPFAGINVITLKPAFLNPTFGTGFLTMRFKYTPSGAGTTAQDFWIKITVDYAPSTFTDEG